MCSECADGSFGLDCNQRCHCKDKSEICRKDNGVCISGCGLHGVTAESGCTEGDNLMFNISTYNINTKMCVCVCVFSRFSRPFRNRLGNPLTQSFILLSKVF